MYKRPGRVKQEEGGDSGRESVGPDDERTRNVTVRVDVRAIRELNI
jgi:hypothetical protein